MKEFTNFQIDGRGKTEANAALDFVSKLGAVLPEAGTYDLVIRTPLEKREEKDFMTGDYMFQFYMRGAYLMKESKKQEYLTGFKIVGVERIGEEY